MKLPGASTPTCPAGQSYNAKTGQCVSSGPTKCGPNQTLLYQVVNGVNTPVCVCPGPNVNAGGTAGCVTPAQVQAAGHPEYDVTYGYSPTGAAYAKSPNPQQMIFFQGGSPGGNWRPFVPVQDSVYGNLIPAAMPMNQIPWLNDPSNTGVYAVLRVRDTTTDPPGGTPRPGAPYTTLWAEDPWPVWFYGPAKSSAVTPDMSGNNQPLNAYDTALRSSLIAALQSTDPTKAAAVSNGTLPFSYANLVISDDGTTTTGVIWAKYFGPATNNVLIIQTQQYTQKDIDPVAWLNNPLKTLIAGAQVITKAIGGCSVAGKAAIGAAGGTAGKLAGGVLCPNTPPPPVCAPPTIYDSVSKQCVNMGGAIYPTGTIARLNTTRNVWSVYVPPQTTTTLPPALPPATAPAGLGHGFPHGGGGGHGGGGHGGRGRGRNFIYNGGGPWWYGGGNDYYYGVPTCPTNYAPVLGSDGRTYHNACYAQMAGVRVVRSLGGNGGLGDVAPVAPNYPGITSAPDVTPAPPPGLYYAGTSAFQPPGTINGGTESDVPIWEKGWFWGVIAGAVAVVGGGAYLITRKRRRTSVAVRLQ